MFRISHWNGQIAAGHTRALFFVVVVLWASFVERLFTSALAGMWSILDYYVIVLIQPPPLNLPPAAVRSYLTGNPLDSSRISLYTYTSALPSPTLSLLINSTATRVRRC